LRSFPQDFSGKLSMLQGVARGLCYLHTLRPKTIHGDLKAANVLVDTSGRPCIADFDLTSIIYSQVSTVTTSSFSGKGSLRWQAPELIKVMTGGPGNANITTESDVYAYGCICLEVFTGRPPWHGYTDWSIIMEIGLKDNRPPRPESTIAGDLDDTMWDLIQDCWRTEPKDRPEMTTVYERLKPGHKWDKEEDEQGIEINDALKQALERFAKLHSLGNVVNEDIHV